MIFQRGGGSGPPPPPSGSAYVCHSICIIKVSTLRLKGSIACFLVVCFCHLLINITRIKKIRKASRVSDSLDPDVGLDVGPNCLQKVSANRTSRQRIIKKQFSISKNARYPNVNMFRPLKFDILDSCLRPRFTGPSRLPLSIQKKTY